MVLKRKFKWHGKGWKVVLKMFPKYPLLSWNKNEVHLWSHIESTQNITMNCFHPPLPRWRNLAFTAVSGLLPRLQPAGEAPQPPPWGTHCPTAASGFTKQRWRHVAGPVALYLAHQIKPPFQALTGSKVQEGVALQVSRRLCVSWQSQADSSVASAGITPWFTAMPIYFVAYIH